MLANALLFILLFVLVYYLPGRIACAVALPSCRPEESLPFSVGLGVVLVNVTAFLGAGFGNLFAPIHLEREGVFFAAAVVVAVLAPLWMGRHDWRPKLRPRWTRPSRNLVALWVFTALSFGFYLLHYDEDSLIQDSCKVRASTSVVANYLQPELISLGTRDGTLDHRLSETLPSAEQGRHRFLIFNQGQRSGPTLLIAPLMAVFGVFGFRLLFALQGLLLPGLGYLAGLYLFKKRWAAWTTALLLTFNPYSLSVQVVDENFLALCYSSLAITLMLRPTPAPFLSGAAMSVFLGVRHVGALVLPFVLVYLWRRVKQPPLSVLRALAGMCLLGLPYVVKHLYQLLSSGNIIDDGAMRPSFEHSFLGLDFESTLMLSFPFTEELLRSPSTGFPTLLAFPLDLVRRFGLLLAALVPAGLVYLHRRERWVTWLLVMWFAPLLAFLMIQSNWSEPEKMGLPASVLLPVVLVMTGGVAWAVDKGTAWWKRLALLALGLVLPLSFHAGVRGYEAPVDARVYQLEREYFPRHADLDQVQEEAAGEVAAFVDWDRDRYAPSLLPRAELGQYRGGVLALRFDQLAEILSHPQLGEFEETFADYVNTLVSPNWSQVKPLSVARVLRTGERSRGYTPIALFAPPAGSAATVYRDLELRLGSPPVLSERLFHEGGRDSKVEPLKIEDGRVYLIRNLPVGWREEPEMLLIARDRLGTVHVYEEPILDADQRIEPPAWLPLVRVDGQAYADLRVPLRLPEGAVIRFVHLPSEAGPRYLRYAVAREDGVSVSPVTVEEAP